MANIKINSLTSNGSNLFADSESYLNDLSDAEVMVQGGRPPLPETMSSFVCDLADYVLSFF